MQVRSTYQRGWLAAAALLAALAAPTSAAAQTEVCPLGRVSRIDVRNNSLFAPEDIEDRKFSWAFGVANAAHFRTREDYLRGQMQLSEGDCYDPETLDASVRYIRELDFIARVQADAKQEPDSTWVVGLQTWDEWSTSGGVYFDVESEFQFIGFYLTEINVLGRGLRLAFRHRDFRERSDDSFTLASTQFLGTPTQAIIAGGTTRTGRYFRQDFTLPLLSESSPFTYLTHVQYQDLEQVYLTDDDVGISHVLLPLTDKTVTLWAKRRFGVPGALGVLGGELQLLRRTVSGPVEQVPHRDFEQATTASDSIVAILSPHAAPDSYVRLGATAGFRRVRFTTRKGLDLISGVQNVALGSELTLTVGRTLATWGTSSTDTYGWLEGWASEAAGPLLANATLRLEGRYLDYPIPGKSRWRDLRLSGRSLFYLQPGGTTAATFITGLRYNLRGNTDQPYQSALGGEESVRGYRNDQLPTGSTLVSFVEERINLPWFHPAVDLGFNVFADYGRGWAENVPFGQNTGWRASVGGGLRIGFPAGTGSVTHVEIVWPIGKGAQGRGPVFRTYWIPQETKR